MNAAELHERLEFLNQCLEQLRAAATDDPDDVQILECAEVERARQMLEAYADGPPPGRDLDSLALPAVGGLLGRLGPGERHIWENRIADAWHVRVGVVRTHVGNAPPGSGDEPEERIHPVDAVQQVVRELGLIQDSMGGYFLRCGSEALALASTPAKAMISSIVKRRFGINVTRQGIDDATLPLFAEEIPVVDIPIRVEGNGERIVLDLADGSGEAIVITAHEVSVGPSPVTFLRPKTVGVLPRPVLPETGAEAQDALGAFFTLAQVQDPMDRAKLFAWQMAQGRRGATYPILNIQGAEGGGKTTLAKLTRSVLDPSTLDVAKVPRRIEDLVPLVRILHTYVFDNVSRLSVDYQDTLCTLATGAGEIRRELYTTADAFVHKAVRPGIVTSVIDAVTQADLLSRCIQFRRGPCTTRISDEEVERRFDELHPKLLGAFCFFMQAALRNHNAVEIPPDVRMHAAAKWAAAAEVTAGFKSGSVVEVYRESRSDGRAIQAEDPVVQAILRWVPTVGTWTGTASDLYVILDDERQRQRPGRPQMGWPESARGLSQALNRHQSLLADQGVVISRPPRVSSSRSLTVSMMRGESNHGTVDLERAVDCTLPAAPPVARSWAHRQVTWGGEPAPVAGSYVIRVGVGRLRGHRLELVAWTDDASIHRLYVDLDCDRDGYEDDVRALGFVGVAQAYDDDRNIAPGDFLFEGSARVTIAVVEDIPLITEIGPVLRYAS